MCFKKDLGNSFIEEGTKTFLEKHASENNDEKRVRQGTSRSI